MKRGGKVMKGPALVGGVGSVREGRVTLTGRVLCGQVRRLLKRISRVPGLTRVDNELEACEPGAWALPHMVTPEARPQ